MNATVPGSACRTSALRQRGPRADVCACRFRSPSHRPLRHHDCATAPLHTASAPIPHPAWPRHPAPPRIPDRSIAIAAKLQPHRGTPRFPPSGLFDACPHARRHRHILAADGRHRITLNDRSPTTTGSGRPSTAVRSGATSTTASEVQRPSVSQRRPASTRPDQPFILSRLRPFRNDLFKTRRTDAVDIHEQFGFAESGRKSQVRL